MRRIFKNEDHQSRFDQQGYLHLPLLEEEDVIELRTFYEQQGLKPKGNYGFHISLDHDDPTKIPAISEKIISVIWPRAKDLFDHCKAFTSSFVIKEPGLSNIVPPHQDWTFVDESKFYSCTLWVALQDVNMENGALCILPGSKNFFNHIRASPSPQSRSPLTDHFNDIFPYMKLIEMKAGEMLIFDNRLIHASPPNTSDKPRIAAGVGVTHEEAQLFHYFQIPNTNPTELEGFKVDNHFFYNFNNHILSELYDAGKQLTGYESLGRQLRQVPMISKEELRSMTLKVEGSKRNDLLIKHLSAMYDHNEDESKQKLDTSPEPEDFKQESKEIDDPWANRTFWQTYTLKNIIAEIKYRLRGRKG